MEYFFQAGKQTSRNLLLLHGTGGDEYSLLETASSLNRMLRFFLFVVQSKKTE